MITKGEILSINLLKNTCIVRLPIFETTNSDIISTEATFSVQPGLYNGYQVGDIVYIGFEQENIKYAVVLGKLYVDAETEAKLNRGAINCNTLRVTDRAELPGNTNINYDKIDDVLNADNSVGKIKTIKDIVDYCQQLEKEINSLKTELDSLKNK